MIDHAGIAPLSEALTFIQWLDAPQDRACLGKKAEALVALLTEGLPVPPGFVVAPEAFGPPLPEDRSATGDTLQPAAAAEIRRAYQELARRLGMADPPVAVRSSAQAEDLPGASFAGQYETYLHVRGEQELLTYVARCWASLSAASALAYRRHNEQRLAAALPPAAMAVLVQALVVAEAGGVAFTAHPSSGDASCILLNAGWGLGQSIVDGEVEADTYLLDRQTLAVVERRIGQKATQTGAGPTAPRQAVPAHLQQAPCLTSEQAAAVARLALQAEAVIGGPADVEWALAAGTVWLLQARPITTVPAPSVAATAAAGDMAGADGSTASPPAPTASAPTLVGPTATFPFLWPDEQAPTWHWQLSSVDQRRREVLRPLEQDVRAVWNRTFAAAATVCGRPRYQTAWHVNGYEYVAEVANPRSEADQALCRQAMEQVGAALSERGESYRPAIQFPAIDAGNARLAAVEEEALAAPALADHLDDTLRWFERLWTEHWTAPEDTPVRRFLHFYKEHFGTPEQQAAASEPTGGLAEQDLEAEARALLTYEPNLLTEAIDGLIELARTVQQHPALQELFRSRPPEAVLGALPRTPGGATLRVQLDRLLQAQGLRSGAGFGTERNQVLPGWAEQPALVLELVQRYVRQDLAALLRARQAAVAERDRRVAELQGRLADETLRKAFIFQLTAARKQQQAFEDHNYKIDSAGGALLHRAITVCARRLVTAGVLAAVEEVWWLRTHEITLALRALADGAAGAAERTAPASGAAWAALIAARRAHHAWCQLLTPPPALGTVSGPPPPPRGSLLGTAPAASSADTAPAGEVALPPDLLLKGEAGSRGVASGRVRLVPHGDLVPDVAAGDVLVANNAGPLWTPVFPIVAAVVLNQGALLQHAMLTCREYGVPAVFQTKDATERLQEGQQVTVEGTRGWVLAAEEA